MGVNINGAPTFPDFQIDYNAFSTEILLAALAFFPVIGLGILHVWKKKWYTGNLYVAVAGATVAMMIMIMGMTFAHRAYLMENDTKICQDIFRVNEINEHYQHLVNKWMCSSDCKCYAGAKNETKKLWEEFGPTGLEQYGRTI